ncbi:Putative esterase [Corynebacterium ciconiae DSM 44920]|uniref:PaaI family thioesterase n=1 Tax=Corynebacterium ciconiae TaxID=227319 RepID=UPI00036C23D5|nr:PaaI family thioesterase [Corynebacterium ciconiae]WKD61144.1 Putative esterase [Corynebacterium ciconiae DSM 44920]
MSVAALLNTATTRPLTDAELTEFNETSTGLDATLGVKYTVISRKQVRAQISVAEGHLQPFGFVNGGVFCSLAESTGSLLGMILANGQHVAGVNNSTDFISSVKAGVVTVIAAPLHNGKTTQLISVECFQRDQLVARTTLRTIRLQG